MDMFKSKNQVRMILLCIPFTILSLSSFAGEEEDMAAMQRMLNGKVMAEEFNPGDMDKIEAYIKKSMKGELKPAAKAPSYWKPGYTCAYIRSYRYNYRHYRNCLYHHRYYGRYW